MLSNTKLSYTNPLVNTLVALAFTTANMAQVSASQLDIALVRRRVPSPGSPAQGLLIEDSLGQVIRSENADTVYNPASAVKVLTAYTVLSSFGPEFRFETKLSVAGKVYSGMLQGDIFLDGRNPFFGAADLVQVEQELARLGINRVSGVLYVSPQFVFNQNAAGSRSAAALSRQILLMRRSSAPGPSVIGHAVLPATVALKTFFGVASVSSVVSSNSLKVIVKDCLSRSDNEQAEVLGRLVGGVPAITRKIANDFSLPPGSIRLETASGLGVNRLSPRSMIKVLRGLKAFLAARNLTISQVLPIAGIDQGTLLKRFSSSVLRGVMVGKTGTLTNSDSGASVLVGEMNALNREQIMFVIFQRGHNTIGLRQSQNRLLEQVLIAYGGPGRFYAG